LTSPDALNSDARVAWRAVPHAGKVTLPNGDQVPVGATSFVQGADDGLFLVMSTPSVWRAGGVDGRSMGLESMMVAVLLHEGSHVSQGGTYGARMSALAERHELPESFNDDSIQKRFKDDADFSISVSRETELFFQAAAADDDAIALRLAREARSLMRARHQRFFTGEDDYLAEAEDIWLTMEGSGQWAGYKWAVNSKGGGMQAADVMTEYVRGGGWWSQSEGFALAMAVDRIVGPGWKRHAFGDGARTLLEMLDLALAEG
jgi:hypothetical protein